MNILLGNLAVKGIFCYCVTLFSCISLDQWCIELYIAYFSLLLLEKKFVWVGMLELFWKHMWSTLSKTDLNSSLEYKYPTGQLTDFSSSLLPRELRCCRRRKGTQEGIPISLLIFKGFFLCLYLYIKQEQNTSSFFKVRKKPVFLDNIMIIILIDIVLSLLMEE